MPARIRSIAFLSLALVAGLTAIAFAAERHRLVYGAPVSPGDWHSYAGELGGLPVIVPLAIALVAPIARRGVPGGLAIGLLGGVGLAFIYSCGASEHPFWRLEHASPVPVLLFLATAAGTLAVGVLDVAALATDLGVDRPSLPIARVARWHP